MTTTAHRRAPSSAAPDAPALTPLELGRWVWRQLTSMRTALLLLLLLAIAAVPGSVVPQADVDAVRVVRWRADHPKLTPIYEQLGLFDVYRSVWFSAIYLLLMVSLVGCIVPRTAAYWRAWRARPPRAPRRLSRLPGHASYAIEGGQERGDLLAAAREVLARRGYRVVVDEDAVAGERGRLRELGNLVFHLAVLVVLVGVAWGGLFGYSGGAIVVVGQSFSNQLAQYDDFVPGALMDVADLQPYALDVRDFDVDFTATGPAVGMPQDFVASVDYTTEPGAPTRSYDLRVNHPLDLGGGSVYLVGHGYAPRLTLRDGTGEVVYSGPTVFLPEDATFASFGVVKAPDAQPQQIGLQGGFYPTYGFTMKTGPFSRYPDAFNPVVSLQVYQGDLGLDQGDGQSVYALDLDGLTELEEADGSMFRLDLALGQTKKLPDGLGTVSFEGLDRWVKLQMGHRPGTWLALSGVILALLGLMGSLFVRPRRAWIRVRPDGEVDLVEVGVLDRTGGSDPRAEAEALLEAFRAAPSSSSGRGSGVRSSPPDPQEDA